MKSLRVHLALLTVQILFGLWPVAAIAVMDRVTPVALTGLRTLLSAPILLLLLRPRRPTAADLPGLLLLGLIGVAANQLLFAEGLKRCGPIDAALLTLLIPALTLLIARLVGQEHPTPRRLLGVGVALAGALVLLQPERLLEGGAGHDARWLGDILILCNVVSYAAYLVFARRMARVMGPAAMVSWVFVVGSLEALPLTAPAIAATDFASIPPWGYASLAFIVLGATVGTYALNAWALARAESSLVAVYIYLQPIIAATTAHLVLGSELSGRALLSGLVIAAGVAISTQAGAGRAAAGRAAAGGAGPDAPPRPAARS